MLSPSNGCKFNLKLSITFNGWLKLPIHWIEKPYNLSNIIINKTNISIVFDWFNGFISTEYLIELMDTVWFWVVFIYFIIFYSMLKLKRVFIDQEHLRFYFIQIYIKNCSFLTVQIQFFNHSGWSLPFFILKINFQALTQFNLSIRLLFGKFNFETFLNCLWYWYTYNSSSFLKAYYYIHITLVYVICWINQ